MPHVASKASVLKPQHTGLTQRERMGEPKDSTSPFSILLGEAGGEAPARPNAKRTNGTSATQRTEPPRSHMHRTDAERPRATDEEASPDAAAQASATQATTTEQGDDEAAKQFEIAAAGQAAVTPELAPQPADSTSDASNEEIVAIDTALAASVATPPSPAQPVALETPSLAAAATPAATASTDPDTVESAAAAGVTATAPAGEVAAVTPDAAVGASAPTVPQAPPPATPAPQAPQASEQAAQQQQQTAAPPPMPEAKSETKPASVEPAATPESANQQPQPSATPETAAAVAPTTGAEHAETRTAPEKPAHTETPTPPPARPHGPDASERSQTASAVSDFIQAAHQQTPDGSQLAHLQSGRDFGQTVAATAQASQSAASNPLMSAPVPLESLAVEIVARAQGGSNRFEIRLDPPELGRIDVRLDIDRSGNVTSRLVVEKAETLDVLRRDAHQLERALQDAGLKTSDNGLQFSLRDQSSAGRDDRNDSNNPRILVADPELPATDAASTAYGLTLRGGSGIDIRV